jgi:hypothetical protein
MGQTASTSTNNNNSNNNNEARSQQQQQQQPKLIPTVPLSKTKKLSTSTPVQEKQRSVPVRPQNSLLLPTPVEWKETFSTLTDQELHELILSAPVSEKDIRTMAKHIVEEQRRQQESLVAQAETHGAVASPTKAASKAASHHSTATSSSSSDNHYYLYHTPEEQENDEFLTALCFRILRISSTMAKLRFKLVPTKLKEHLFWQSLWTILYYEAIHQQKQQQQQVEEEVVGEDNEETTPQKTSPIVKQQQHRRQPTASSTSSSYNSIDESLNSMSVDDDRLFQDFQKEQVEKTIFKLRRQIERQQWKIEELQQTVMSLREEQMERKHRQQQQQQEEEEVQTMNATYAPASPPSTSTSDDNDTSQQQQQQQQQQVQHHHVGEWTMDQDSIDFLQYPEELKQNLRDEKRKRLEEVRGQMRFILDTDNVEDSNGRWTCCQSQQYKSVCTVAADAGSSK